LLWIKCEQPATWESTAVTSQGAWARPSVIEINATCC